LLIIWVVHSPTKSFLIRWPDEHANQHQRAPIAQEIVEKGGGTSTKTSHKTIKSSQLKSNFKVNKYSFHASFFLGW
jgi:hypothetical protein